MGGYAQSLDALLDEVSKNEPREVAKTFQKAASKKIKAFGKEIAAKEKQEKKELAAKKKSEKQARKISGSKGGARDPRAKVDWESPSQHLETEGMECLRKECQKKQEPDKQKFIEIEGEWCAVLWPHKCVDGAKGVYSPRSKTFPTVAYSTADYIRCQRLHTPAYRRARPPSSKKGGK